MAESSAAFQVRQLAFAAHLRDPDRHGFASVEPRRLRVYRELFYNTVEDCLASAFPVLRRLDEAGAWHRRVRDFYARHRSPVPQLHRLPEEFLHFLEATRDERPQDPPWWLELAHYEWVELALAIAPEALDAVAADADGDLLSGSPVLSPVAWTLCYRWPVQRIGPDWRPQAEPETPTWLIVNRDREDAVRFLEINAVTARLVALIEAEPQASGAALVERIAGELGRPGDPQIHAQGGELLERLRARDILLGTRPS